MHISKRINIYAHIVIISTLYLSSFNDYVRVATNLISSFILLLFMYKLVLIENENIQIKENFFNFIKSVYGILITLIVVFIYRLLYCEIDLGYALFLLVFPNVLIFSIFESLHTGWHRTNMSLYRRGTIGFNINLYFEISIFLCLLSEKENHCFFVVLVISYLAMGVILKAISYILERNY